MNTVAVIDFETTGLSPDYGDRATEVAVVMVENGRVIERFQSLMNSGVRVPGFIEHLTGISNEMLKHAPPTQQVMRDLDAFIGDVPLVAHNASFDRKFLDAEFDRVQVRRKQDFICSMRVARRVYPEAPNHKLGTLVEYTGIHSAGRAHRALADAEMTASLWLKMQDDICQKYRFTDMPIELMTQLQSIPVKSFDAFMCKQYDTVSAAS